MHNEPNFAQSTLQVFTSQENRSVVTAAGMFAVRHPQSKWNGEMDGRRRGDNAGYVGDMRIKANEAIIDRRRVPAQQLG
jgi:hypothetical protein